MPHKDPEARKAYKKAYREKNREKFIEWQRAWTERNQEKETARKKAYYEANKEKCDEKNKAWNQSPEGKKYNTIRRWKRRGVVSDDFDALYEKYINTWKCEECDCDLVEGMYGANKRVLDHCHETGEFRNILCNTCNTKRG